MPAEHQRHQQSSPRWLEGHPRFARLYNDLRHGAQSSISGGWDFYSRQPPVRRVLLLLAGTVLLAIGVVFIIFHKKAFEVLLSFADSWRELTWGPVIMFALITLISFPPLIGYSMLSSLCGMMYGFWGWPLLAAATIFGSFMSFLACRHLFQDYARHLARSNHKFAALTGTMQQDDGFRLLWMIRLCPLPYSLSNGALASIPTVSPVKFALATAITSPKLFMHIFVGDRIARLGAETDSASRWINILSVGVAVGVGSFTAYTIYVRTIEKAEQDEQAYTELELGEAAVMPQTRDSFEIGEDDEDEFEYDEEERNHNKAS